ncbi:hypothetical protein CPAR01_04003 [Colletotrichum paranaense]|uniref:Uncharacterized protein n=1 Tax=Colletotrichum paranaense TaxID=1914294 RepID=A0ABQ9SV29_9PEZI|nr:uncharacterized protein CPAR01_04003 [Colletotrichum paranaense]KAK1543370.1 hypothetical protein CPAR01_04003 [Colletotrichum paranaense]
MSQCKVHPPGLRVSLSRCSLTITISLARSHIRRSCLNRESLFPFRSPTVYIVHPFRKRYCIFTIHGRTPQPRYVSTLQTLLDPFRNVRCPTESRYSLHRKRNKISHLRTMLTIVNVPAWVWPCVAATRDHQRICPGAAAQQWAPSSTGSSTGTSSVPLIPLPTATTSARSRLLCHGEPCLTRFIREIENLARRGAHLYPRSLEHHDTCQENAPLPRRLSKGARHWADRI